MSTSARKTNGLMGVKNGKDAFTFLDEKFGL